MMKTRYSPETQLLLGLFVLLVPLLLAGLFVLPAEAQCKVRTDWPTYTVVQGDTLFSIARRFNTTVATLTQANCLSNSARILVGQQLRVPPNGTSTATGTTIPGFTADLPVNPNSRLSVPSTSQQFDNGFMTWRSDNGGIWVFLNSGRVVAYPLAKYGGLSGGARYMGIAIPDGRRFPDGGFKKVWDNFPGVRSGLSWAIGSEVGYDMSLNSSTAGNYFTMSLPDKRFIRVEANGTWVYTGGIS
jgi:murein DD-endopeptidase MepM/ murein hydrolase activator NlpD